MASFSLWPFGGKASAVDKERNETLKWLLQEKLIGIDYFLRVSKLPASLPGEYEEEKPPKTTADLRAEADQHYEESKQWIMQSLKDPEEQRKALGQAHIWYLRRMTAINTQGQLI